MSATPGQRLSGAGPPTQIFGPATPRAEVHPTVCLEMKPVGKPDTGDPYVRLMSGDGKRGDANLAQATAPVLDSTKRGRADEVAGAALVRMAERAMTPFIGAYRGAPSPPAGPACRTLR
jgi:hypothetical protein